MNDRREEMDAELKSTIVPVLRQSGFKGSFPHFRRPSQTAIDLLTFQFDRNGGGFVIEIAQCTSDGVTTPWGQHISGTKVRALDLHPDRRYRIQPRAGGGVDAWFRFDMDQVTYAAQQALKALPRAESWWREAQPGSQQDAAR
jgi:hypothetical protein